MSGACHILFGRGVGLWQEGHPLRARHHCWGGKEKGASRGALSRQPVMMIGRLKAERYAEHSHRFIASLDMIGIEAMHGADRGAYTCHQVKAIACLQVDLPAARVR